MPHLDNEIFSRITNLDNLLDFSKFDKIKEDSTTKNTQHLALFESVDGPNRN
jgi:hypothetical protein